LLRSKLRLCRKKGKIWLHRKKGKILLSRNISEKLGVFNIKGLGITHMNVQRKEV